MSSLLSRRDWVYVLSLLVPFAVYNLSLKTASVLSRPGDLGLALTFDLMRSDVFFNLGYALLWIGLFAAVRRGLLRRILVVVFHAGTILVLTVNTVAHQYFRDSGTTLDYSIIAEWIPKFHEVVPILVGDVPLWSWVLLFAALFYAALGPWFISHAVERWRGQSEVFPSGTGGTSYLALVGLLLLASGFGTLSLLIGPSPAGANESFARDQFVNVLLTGLEEATAADPYAGMNVENPAVNAQLAETSKTEKRNVVLIHLESTRAQSVTPYNKDLDTTPFLNELAQESLLAERAYTTVPRSSKASVSVNCGVEPPLQPGPEFEPGGIPARCLAELLRDQGYRTVFFASTFNNMDNFGNVAQGFGYDEIYSAENMDPKDFVITNTFGYEDEIMLEPSEQWLRERGPEEPFMAEYFTGTGHYDYECMGTRYGTEDFSENDEINRYHNCLRLQDIFLKKLFDQYKQLGIYEDTIFVIFGDHGEGFGEHDRSMHGDTIYEEGLKVPLIIHDPQRFQNGERVGGLSSQMDILPTVVQMLGFEIVGGEYPGYSLLNPLPASRKLMFSCITNRKCLASIQGYEKYIYHYGDQPEEVFDLFEDPLEKNNLADDWSTEDLDEHREDLLLWRSRVNAEYSNSSSSTSMNPR